MILGQRLDDNKITEVTSEQFTFLVELLNRDEPDVNRAGQSVLHKAMNVFIRGLLRDRTYPIPENFETHLDTLLTLGNPYTISAALRVIEVKLKLNPEYPLPSAYQKNLEGWLKHGDNLVKGPILRITYHQLKRERAHKLPEVDFDTLITEGDDYVKLGALWILQLSLRRNPEYLFPKSLMECSDSLLTESDDYAKTAYLELLETKLKKEADFKLPDSFDTHLGSLLESTNPYVLSVTLKILSHRFNNGYAVPEIFKKSIQTLLQQTDTEVLKLLNSILNLYPNLLPKPKLQTNEGPIVLESLLHDGWETLRTNIHAQDEALTPDKRQIRSIVRMVLENPENYDIETVDLHALLDEYQLIRSGERKEGIEEDRRQTEQRIGAYLNYHAPRFDGLWDNFTEHLNFYMNAVRTHLPQAKTLTAEQVKKYYPVLEADEQTRKLLDAKYGFLNGYAYLEPNDDQALSEAFPEIGYSEDNWATAVYNTTYWLAEDEINRQEGQPMGT